MILKNSKGREKEFTLVMKVEENNKEYIIYKDSYMNKYYAGKKEKNKLKKLTIKEEEMINNLLERFN